MPVLLAPEISLPSHRQRPIPRVEESLDDCGYLFHTFRACLAGRGLTGIIAIHFSRGHFLRGAMNRSVALFIRITQKKLHGRIEGGYQAGPNEFFLLLAPAGPYSDTLFMQDIDTIRHELERYCLLPIVARRISALGGAGPFVPEVEGICIAAQEETSGSSTLFRAFRALLTASTGTAPSKPADQLVIEEIISRQLITPVYQPIFSLQDREVHGYEALSRIRRTEASLSTEELFARAAKYGLAPSLEMLCRKKALIGATKQGIGGRIFLNVCPNLLQASEHERGMTAALLDKLGIERTRITFELTERTMIEDYELFHRVLAHYRGQGYSIAIDDLGSGYAGLKMLAKLEPDYVKLARFLTSGIDTSTTQQALVEALLTFCTRIGAKVIAEGIERKEELEYLTSAGVPFGQGYLLAKPSPHPVPQGSILHSPAGL